MGHVENHEVELVIPFQQNNRKRKFRRNLTPFWFILPALIVMVGILVYPLLQMLIISFREELMISPHHPFIGLKNYLTMGTFFNMPTMIINTLEWDIGSMAIQCLLGFSMAILLNNETRTSRLIRALVLIPWTASPVVAAAIWSWIYEPSYGILDSLLHRSTAWLSTPHLAMWSLIIANVWIGFPFWMIMITSGLKTVSHDLYEAATIDGANSYQKFIHVTLPGIRTILELTSLLALIFTTNSFGFMQILTGGGPGDSTFTVPFAIYSFAFVQQDIGGAAALSVLLTIVMSIVVIIYFRVARRAEAEGLR